MKAIQFTEPRQIRIVDIPEPLPPARGEVTVRTHRAGICGTDYSSYLGKFPFFDYPRIPGHELGVEVVEVGSDVDNVAVGDRCSVEPYMNCGSCFACRCGNTNCCSNLNVIGVMVDGGLCESFNIRADKLHVSSQLAFDQLALVETLAIGCHAIARAQPSNNTRLLIIGAGPIGLATLEFAILAGARVTMMDISAAKLQFCSDHYGIENTIVAVDADSDFRKVEHASSGEFFPVVVDATGNAQSMSAAIRYLSPGGKLVYVGISTQNIEFPHPIFHKPEATLLASRNALPGDFSRIIELIESDKIQTDKWISHRTSLSALEQDLPDFVQAESGVIKAVVSVQD